MLYRNMCEGPLSAVLLGHANAVNSDLQHNGGWEPLIHLASSEQILPALHDSLTALNLTPHLPADVADFLSAVKELNRERNQRILAQARAAIEALNRAGIEPVALKGLACLLAGIYPDRGTRFLADIDLLVPESDFAASVEILTGLGYSPIEDNPIDLAIGHTYPALVRPDSIEIDLHRYLGLGLSRSLLPAAEVLRDSVPHEFDGVRLRLPSPEHLVTHHIVHSQIHDFYRQRIWPSLRGMYDLLLLQRHFGARIPWTAIQARFERHRQYPVLALYLLQVEKVLGLERPIPLRLNPLTRLRWWRRQVLRRAPLLRFIDPIYLLFAGPLPRTRRLRDILRVPGGWRYLLGKFVSQKFYARLRADFS
ncbi:MAG: nucleotidyltransferase family protein [Acidobacteriaceae bacterium]|nr:nucleotidyltransferase family protein [Acidobacteriaceae bacterium]